MRYRNYPEEKLLPFHIIEAASLGDLDALRQVLKHFRGYIDTLSMRTYYDGFGHSFERVDPEVRHYLENTLVTRIIQHFDAF